MTSTKLSKITAVALTLGAPAFAAAESSLTVRARSTPILPEGIGVQVGGGVTGFSRAETRDLLGTGAYWDARAAIGTRSFLGAELAYTGSLRPVEGVTGGDAGLIGNGAEGVVRANLPLSLGRTRLTPFAFGGVGWTYYQLAKDEGAVVTGIAEDAHALTVPFGAGVSFAYDRWLVDARFTYRPVFDDDLVASEKAGESADLQNWSAGVTLGYEF